MKLISVVVPAYNEECCILPLVNAIKDVMPVGYNFELIIVDDGSLDNSFELIKQLAEDNPFLKGVKLSKNMGHQAALDCGLKHATGDAIICMDADLQHPPKLIPQMIKHWEEGYDIITTQKIENQDYTVGYKLFSKFFYYIFNKYSHTKITPNASDFRLMSRKSLNAVLRMSEYHRFYRGMVPFVGFKTLNIPFNTDKRFAGEKKYDFKQSLQLASNGILSFSDFALKIPFFIGLFSLLVILFYLFVSLILFCFGKITLTHGWTSIVIIMVLSISLQLVFMGIMGIYIGKIFAEVKRRPVFFVDEVAGKIEIKNE